MFIADILFLNFLTKPVHLEYGQTSDISRTKTHKLYVARLVLKLSLPNPMKPDVKPRMKM